MFKVKKQKLMQQRLLGGAKFLGFSAIVFLAGYGIQLLLAWNPIITGFMLLMATFIIASYLLGRRCE